MSAKSRPLPYGVHRIIAIRRAELKLTLGDVASACERSVSYISDIEHGRRELSLVMAVRLAGALKLRAAGLLSMVLQRQIESDGLLFVVSVMERAP